MAQTDEKTAEAETAPAQPQPSAASAQPPAEKPASPDQPEPAADAADPDSSERVSWTASEFVAHNKTAGWYLLAAVGTAALAALVFLITRDPVSVGVVIVAGLIFGIYGSHRPRQLEYAVDGHGIKVDRKYYLYDEFNSFAVTGSGALPSLVFMPLKRFAVPLTVYYPPDDEEKILGILSSRLPLREEYRDHIENLMRRLRF